MKKTIIVMSIFFISSPLASANVFGKYEGISNNNKKCTLEFYRLSQKEEKNNLIVHTKLSFANKIVKEKAFKFKTSIKDFNEAVKNGYIMSSKSKERDWINYSRSEELEIFLDPNGSLENATVKVKDDRWYRGEAQAQGTCDNLRKIRDEFLGGVLKKKDGSRMGLKCLRYFEDGNCKKAKVMSKYSTNDAYAGFSIINIDKLEMAEVRAEAYHRAGYRLNSSYREAATTVTVSTLTSNNEMLFPGGVAIDILKSPVVLVAYLVHKPADLIARRKMIKGLEFMLNPQNKSKEERISSRYFTSLNNTIR